MSEIVDKIKQNLNIVIPISIIILFIMVSIIYFYIKLNESPEPRPGVLSEWSECTEKCGSGIQVRSYTPPINGGNDIDGKNKLVQYCNTQPCENKPTPPSTSIISGITQAVADTAKSVVSALTPSSTPAPVQIPTSDPAPTPAPMTTPTPVIEPTTTSTTVPVPDPTLNPALSPAPVNDTIGTSTFSNYNEWLTGRIKKMI